MRRQITTSWYREDSKGFTLLELLVSIAVIVVLASILLTALSRARDMADSTVCKSNLKQIGIALQLYLNETGYYPSTEDTVFGTSRFSRANWIYTLDRQMGHQFRDSLNSHLRMLDPAFKTVFRCPGFAKITTNVFSYGYNCAGVSPLQDSTYSKGSELGLAGSGEVKNGIVINVNAVNENEVVNPASMVAVGDSDRRQAQTYGDPDLSTLIKYGADNYYSTYRNDSIFNRHRGRWNTVFCDGHVDTSKPNGLFDNKNNAIRRIWNKDNEPHPELQGF